MPDLPDSVDDPRRERLCEHPLVKHFLGTQLHVLAQAAADVRAIALSDMFGTGRAA